MHRLNVFSNQLVDGTESDVVWKPSVELTEQSLLYHFMEAVNQSYGNGYQTFESFHKWSVDDIGRFWWEFWKFSGVEGKPGNTLASNPSDMLRARFFPESTFNFAQNCLRRRGDEIAVIYTEENQRESSISWNELYSMVARVAAAMKSLGIQKGDRVCAVVSNCPEALVCMLATASMGAVWSSVSPDFGVEGVVERFGQIRPKLLFYTPTYKNKSKHFDITCKVKEIEAALIQLSPGLVSVSIGEGFLISSADTDARDVIFEATNFNDPLFIIFSSGTTGKPKCIVHRHGVLLQLMKEHQLHCDIRPNDRVLYYTTTTWMMWNWLVSALASEATILLYDGNPLYPDTNSLFQFASKHHCSFFGVSAKFLDSLKTSREFVSPPPNFESVRTIASTGSALVPESFDFVYSRIKKDVNLASICGGTDILSCFILGCPIKPVKRGFSQCRGLGMDVQIWDPDTGKAVVGEKGELVCCKPFPSQPIGFWGDDPAQSKYRETYYADFPNVWKHGDFCSIDSDGHVFVYGRSDATLKPGGVRIGTAEIYRAVESLSFIKESICCGIELKQGEESVALFVSLTDGKGVLTSAQKDQIRKAIAKSATRHHVPKIIEQVGDIPRTKSGKIVELAVKNVLHNRPIRNLNSLANPEALDLFKPFAIGVHK